MEDWRYSSTILDLSTRWRQVVSFTLKTLYPAQTSSLYPAAMPNELHRQVTKHISMCVYVGLYVRFITKSTEICKRIN
jgi:hypothetical protein